MFLFCGEPRDSRSRGACFIPLWTAAEIYLVLLCFYRSTPVQLSPSFFRTCYLFTTCSYPPLRTPWRASRWPCCWRPSWPGLGWCRRRTPRPRAWKSPTPWCACCSSGGGRLRRGGARLLQPWGGGVAAQQSSRVLPRRPRRLVSRRVLTRSPCARNQAGQTVAGREPVEGAPQNTSPKKKAPVLSSLARARRSARRGAAPWHRLRVAGSGTVREWLPHGKDLFSVSEELFLSHFSLSNGI